MHKGWPAGAGLNPQARGQLHARADELGLSDGSASALRWPWPLQRLPALTWHETARSTAWRGRKHTQFIPNEEVPGTWGLVFKRGKP